MGGYEGVAASPPESPLEGRVAGKQLHTLTIDHARLLMHR